MIEEPPSPLSTMAICVAHPYVPIKASRFQASMVKKPPATTIDVVFPTSEIDRSTMTGNCEVSEASFLDEKCLPVPGVGLAVAVGLEEATPVPNTEGECEDRVLT
jgi:hypothetical protein